MTTERPLVEWARRFQTTCHGSPQHLREKMEATLLPMIRCALKSGLGQPTLVRWVRDHAGPQHAVGANDRLRLAAPLAAELCEHLMARLVPTAERETVLGI